MIETVLIVFAALSVIAFFLYASDKRKAKKKINLTSYKNVLFC